MHSFVKQMSIVLFVFAIVVFTGCGESGNGSVAQPPAGNPNPPASPVFPISNTVEISSVAQLDEIRNNLAGDYRLIADISLEAYGDWEPIGSETAPFTGTFDGNGYKITGMKIRKTTGSSSLFDVEVTQSTVDLAGFFGYAHGAIITSLALEDIDIVGGDYAGGIAGFAADSVIRNCSSAGRISATTSPFSSAGGIAGGVRNSTIEDCSSTADIVSNDLAGGITGIATNSTIRNCFSAGGVNAEWEAGGIAGNVTGSIIRDCYSTGYIHGRIAGCIAGGVCIDCTIIECVCECTGLRDGSCGGTGIGAGGAPNSRGGNGGGGIRLRDGSGGNPDCPFLQ